MRSLPAFFIALLCLGGASCNKDDDASSEVPPPPEPLIKVVTRVIGNDSLRYDCFYGADDLLDSVRIYSNSVFRETRSFKHFGDVTVLNEDKHGPGQVGDSLFFDGGQRLMKRINFAFRRAELQWNNLYDAGGRWLYTINVSANPDDTTIHEWSAGNWTASCYKNGDTTRFTYNGQPWKHGDMRHMIDLLNQGRNLRKSVHLRTALTDNGAVTQYQYSYDSLGRIAKVQASGAFNAEYFYEY